MTFLFWLLLALIIYCYFGYPLALVLISKVFTRAVKRNDILPTVSVAIAVYNEEDVIRRKLENLAALDYPKERMEILVGSDGSSDQTDKIIQSFPDLRIQLFTNSLRRGKASIINELVPKARGEIIVFTDARQIFAVDAVRELVKNFSDPHVGCVSGELIFRAHGVGGTGKGINLYWEYEKNIRNAESKIHSMLGATGAIYAIRKELYSTLPTDIILDDMFTPLQIVERGYRSIFDENAKAFDQVADNPKEEYRRKARTLFGNYQIFSRFRKMFIPWQSPIAIQLFSHKFLRVLIPFFMIGIFILNFLLPQDGPYGTILHLQIIFYALASLGALLRDQKCGILGVIARISYVPYVFCLLNFSALIGFTRFINAKQKVTWEKARHV